MATIAIEVNEKDFIYRLKPKAKLAQVVLITKEGIHIEDCGENYDPNAYHPIFITYSEFNDYWEKVDVTVKAS